MSKRADFCLLCGNSPCSCVKTPRKKLAGRKPSTEKPVVESTTNQQPASVVPSTTAPRAGLSKSKAIEPAVAAPKRTETVVESDEDEQTYRNALTMLVRSGLIAESSIREHRNDIDLTDTEIRAILWRQSNGRFDL